MIHRITCRFYPFGLSGSFLQVVRRWPSLEPCEVGTRSNLLSHFRSSLVLVVVSLQKSWSCGWSRVKGSTFCNLLNWTRNRVWNSCTMWKHNIHWFPGHIVHQTHVWHIGDRHFTAGRGPCHSTRCSVVFVGNCRGPLPRSQLPSWQAGLGCSDSATPVRILCDVTWRQDNTSNERLWRQYQTGPAYHDGSSSQKIHLTGQSAGFAMREETSLFSWFQ